MHPKEIVILVNTGNCSGRDILRGVLRFYSTSSRWRIRICDFADHGAQRALAFLATEHIDGIITSELENTKIADRLEKSQTPLAVIGTRKNALPKRRENMITITSDEISVGELGAQTLLQLGVFNSFGFVNMRHDTYRYLSSLRERGFVLRLQKSGITPQIYDTTIPESHSDEATLCEWVRSLPKPAAILAASDGRAEDVLRASVREGFNIPTDVSLLGIDDDEFKCLSTVPTLSSIHLDAERLGFEAARQLSKLLHVHHQSQKRSCCFAGTVNVVKRGSTHTLAPGRFLVTRAREFIAKNADRHLTIADVVTFSHVSQRLLYLRFKEFSDKSLQETINAERIKYFCKRLQTGSGTIRDIAKRCGFNNMATLRALFSASTGTTIREWRKRQHSKSANQVLKTSNGRSIGRSG